jgi:DNA-binding NarL/FixJ family response regulator
VAEKNSIVIAEDQRILREGLRSILSPNEAIEIVGEAEDGLEAIRAVEERSPNLLLLDIGMPRMSGLSAIKEIKDRFPDTKILALTIHESDEYVLEAFQAGVDGYCLKDASASELRVAIETVLSGRRYISPGISDKVLVEYSGQKKTFKSTATWDELTRRQKEVLKLVGEGYKNKEIADFLGISEKTVEKHRSNIMMKLDMHTASALTAYAIEKGLVTKSPTRP